VEQITVVFETKPEPLAGLVPAIFSVARKQQFLNRAVLWRIRGDIMKRTLFALRAASSLDQP
jgi:hypothetical protein